MPERRFWRPAVVLSLPGSRSQTPCACGQTAQYHDTRPKELLTVLGPVKFQRRYYVCPHCRQGQLRARSGTGCRRRLLFARSATHDSGGGQRIQLPNRAANNWNCWPVSRSPPKPWRRPGRGHRRRYRSLPAARNWTGQTIGTPRGLALLPCPSSTSRWTARVYSVVKAETEGRAGRVGGQPALTRARSNSDACSPRPPPTRTAVRCVTRSPLPMWPPSRPPNKFGLRLYSEAWRRGWSRAQKKVVIGDVAGWIWNLADQHFPSAIQIVDLYHARQQLWELSSQLFPNEPKARQRWIARCLDRLERGKVEALVKILREPCSPAPTNLRKPRQ